LKLTPDDVKEQIFKLAKKGLTPSQIGVYLKKHMKYILRHYFIVDIVFISSMLNQLNSIAAKLVPNIF
jgi:hypothetical protein